MKKKEINSYRLFGDHWKAEVMKLPKKDIVNLWAKSMQHKNIIPHGEIAGCQRYVEGCINDFELGLSDKEELMNQMEEYTLRLMDIFWESAKRKIKDNPELINPHVDKN